MVFTAFCFASLLCLLCSSIYHTFICHSAHHVKSFTATLDYIGITFLITASISTIVHFGFYCDPVSRNRYLMFSCLIGSIGVILPFFRFFDTKRYRPLRIGLFVVMAFSSIVPLLHLITVKGFVHSFEFLKPALLGAAMYVCGVTVYAKRFPEKFFPGKFDFTGMTSHAIWHIFVCLGILVSLLFLFFYFFFIVWLNSFYIVSLHWIIPLLQSTRFLWLYGLLTLQKFDSSFIYSKKYSITLYFPPPHLSFFIS